MVGTSGNQSPKRATTTLQRSGDVHDMEHLEGKKQKDFPRRGHGCSTSGLESQGGHALGCLTTRLSLHCVTPQEG